jgi:hypothetical protein
MLCGTSDSAGDFGRSPVSVTFCLTRACLFVGQDKDYNWYVLLLR